MPRNPSVLRKTVLRNKTEEELRALADEQGVKVNKTAKKDEIIAKLVQNSYPIFNLPKVRANSRRGATILAFVDDQGKPHKEGTDLAATIDNLVTNFGMSKDEATATVNLYKRDLVRYYGYTLTSENDGVVKFSDARRKLVQKENGTS